MSTFAKIRIQRSSLMATFSGKFSSSHSLRQQCSTYPRKSSCSSVFFCWMPRLIAWSSIVRINRRSGSLCFTFCWWLLDILLSKNFHSWHFKFLCGLEAKKLHERSVPALLEIASNQMLLLNSGGKNWKFRKAEKREGREKGGERKKQNSWVRGERQHLDDSRHGRSDVHLMGLLWA
jgi:hypothetical protein